MRHFVQFHNPDVWGEAVDLDNAFRVSTAKSIRRLPGQRVWLVSRTGAPRTYFVASTFVVDSTETDYRRRFPNTVNGQNGQVLGPKARVDTAKWWPKLLAQTGSFLWGLTEIRDPSIVRGLESVARGADPSSTRAAGQTTPSRPGRRFGRRGAGFGDPESNKIVERAAVAWVKRFLRRKGWTVRSVEPEARGFDLLCRRAAETLHVEVKGVSGDTPSFIITSNEYRECCADPLWRAAVVTNARSRQPDLAMVTPLQFRRRFELVPKDYLVIPR